MERRKGFTLVELLITVVIIAIIAGMVMVAMYTATEAAKKQKTKALVAKLNEIVLRRYDDYRTRHVQVNTTGLQPNAIAKLRIDALREVMRREMPDRWSDVYDPPVTLMPTLPSSSQSYRNTYMAVTGGLAEDTSKLEHQGAECLYMIVMQAAAEGGDSRDVFKPANIGDVDGDGFPEFIDAWGMPIEFIRWPAGFISDLNAAGKAISGTVNAGPPASIRIPVPTSNLSSSPERYIGGAIGIVENDGRLNPARMARVSGCIYDDAGNPLDRTDHVVTVTCEPIGAIQPFGGNPPANGDKLVLFAKDPFDWRQVYPIPQVESGTADTEPVPRLIYPLIYSAGPNRCYGIRTNFSPAIVYSTRSFNPFVVDSGNLIGEVGDFPGEDNFVPSGWKDNIHSHLLNQR